MYILLDSLLWGSTVGCPSDSLASCNTFIRPSSKLPKFKFPKLPKLPNSQETLHSSVYSMVFESTVVIVLVLSLYTTPLSSVYRL